MKRARCNSSTDLGSNLPELGVGIVYFPGLEPLLEERPGTVDLLEIEPQTTWLERPERPGEIFVLPEVEQQLAELPYRKLVHSVRTPVGGSVPGIEMQLPLLRECVRRWKAPWASEHLAFNLTPDFFTGFFLPPRQTAAGVEVYVPAIRRLAEAVEVPFAFETGVNYLRSRADEIPDGEFVAEVAERAECGILLDLHNIYANEWNGRQKVKDFLKQIPLDRVWEMHVAGGFEMDGYWLDAHSGAMPDAMVGLAQEIIPNLPNLKAIVFEMFTSFLPRFGLDAIGSECDRVRGLWEMRRTWVPEPLVAARHLSDDEIVAKVGRPDSPMTVNVGDGMAKEPAIEVLEWEKALGGLVVGRKPDGAVAQELSEDKGVVLIEALIKEFRASMVVGVYRLSSRLMMLTLTPDVFRALLEDFWKYEPPRQYAAAEAEAFVRYLRGKNVHWPQLEKVMEFEHAAVDVLMNGEARVVKFPADPFPMLRALAEGRLPDVIPQVGDYEIELKPDGPITVSGMDLEQVRGAFPFH